MTNQERYEEYNKVFSKSELTFEEWGVMTEVDTTCPKVPTLDMSIFPDTLENITCMHPDLRGIRFCPTHIRLTRIKVFSVRLWSIRIPKELKSVKVLNIVAPISTLSLGGSVSSIEELSLDYTLCAIKSLPSGMESLTKLTVGSKETEIKIPEDAISLTDITISIADNTHPYQIPDALVNMKRLHMHGNFPGVIIPDTVDKIKDLSIRSHSGTFHIYGNPRPRKLSLTLPRIFSMDTIDPEIFTNVIRLEISTKVPNVLCEQMADVKYLTIKTEDKYKMVIPKYLTKLIAITLYNGIFTLESVMDTLCNIKMLSGKLTLHEDATLPNVKVMMAPNGIINNIPRDIESREDVFIKLDYSK